VFARSTTITTAASMIDRGIVFVEDEVLPDVLSTPGCVGLSLLVDHSLSRLIATSSWIDEESMLATTQSIRPLRDRLVAEVGGSAPTVEEWEIALMHRDHRSTPGARSRVSWLQGDSVAIDQAVETFRTILPALDALPGFGSASLLVNRPAGTAVSTATYDGAQALAETRAKANDLRTFVAAETGADVLEVAEFELAVAHLRVPEMA
jgi:hypothetical protein